MTLVKILNDNHESIIYNKGLLLEEDDKIIIYKCPSCDIETVPQEGYWCTNCIETEDFIFDYQQ